MKRKIILRSISGFPVGVSIGYWITIALSLIWGDGSYEPCVPELTKVMGSEIAAVTLQTVLCGVLGAGFAGSSVIWEVDSWSIVKQTRIYFTVTSLTMLPIAYFTYWMEHSVAGLLSYFGIFVLIFAFFWIAQVAIGKHNVKKMNENLHNVKRDEEES